MQTKTLRRAALLLAAVLVPACATLGQVLQPLGFRVAEGQQAQLRLVGPRPGQPLGGASLRLFARVNNPNPLGLTLARVDGGLLLEGRQAARVDFPLGIPLRAGQDTVIPMDIGISFSDLPGLADLAGRAFRGESMNYQLDGSFSVDAGPLGQPSFGPSTLLRGQARVFR